MEIPQPLQRTEPFRKAFSEWKEGVGRFMVQKKIRELFERAMLEQAGGDCDIVQTRSYAIFILHPVTKWETDVYRYLVDHWKELILRQGYYSYISDFRNELLDGGLRLRIERHYLKPEVGEQLPNNEPVSRLYGNITLELIMSGQEVGYLKLTMGYFHEHNRPLEMGLERLMETLLK